MRCTVRETFEYAALSGRPARCRLWVYDAPGVRPVVIVADHPRPGAGDVRRAAELLAYHLGRRLFPEGREFRLVEYRRDDARRAEAFAEVVFRYVDDGRPFPVGPRDAFRPPLPLLARAPRRRTMSRAELEYLIDAPFDAADRPDERWAGRQGPGDDAAPGTSAATRPHV